MSKSHKKRDGMHRKFAESAAIERRARVLLRTPVLPHRASAAEIALAAGMPRREVLGLLDKLKREHMTVRDGGYQWSRLQPRDAFKTPESAKKPSKH